MILILFKGVLNWGVKRRFLEYNPATPVQALPNPRKEYAYWSKADIERFLEFHAQAYFYPLIVMALNTGMRLGELTGLQWDMVDLERYVIRVARTWCNREQRLKDTTKSKKARSIPINDTLHQLLVERKSESKAPWVITQRRRHKRFGSNNFTGQVFRGACRKAGVKEIRFHDLRHTYASHFVMNGGDLYVLQKLLGHHSVTETERYAHLSPDYLQGAAGVVEFGHVELPMDGKVISLAQFRKSR